MHRDNADSTWQIFINHEILSVDSESLIREILLNTVTTFLYEFIGAVVITDGVFALPDAITVDSLLAQLRASTVCCSFIKVGSGFHAHCRLILLDIQFKILYYSVDFVVVWLDSVCFVKDSQFFVTVLLTKLYLNGYFPLYSFLYIYFKFLLYICVYIFLYSLYLSA